MNTLIRNGPQPWRKRLYDLDVDELVDGVRSLVTFARGDGPQLGLPARELVEGILVAHEAATARSLLASGKNLRPRQLAALAGVTVTRVRQLVLGGRLRRSEGRITADSAKRWLDLSPQPPWLRHRITLRPAWWDARRLRWSAVLELDRELPTLAPVGCELLYPPGGPPGLVIPRSAQLDTEGAANLRDRLVEWLEAHDPGQ